MNCGIKAGIVSICEVESKWFEQDVKVAGEPSRGPMVEKPTGPDTDPRICETVSLIERIASERNASREAIVIAWISCVTREGFVPVVGTTTLIGLELAAREPKRSFRGLNGTRSIAQQWGMGCCDWRAVTADSSPKCVFLFFSICHWIGDWDSKA
jgi:hypothetical protein